MDHKKQGIIKVLLFFISLLSLGNAVQQPIKISVDPVISVNPVSYISPLAACPKLPAVPDTNDVNNLRPGNIKVVMAMGDSITAGQAAKDASLVSTKEYRGLAYSIGSDAGITTFPNLLQDVSTNSIYGGSTGIGKRDSATTGYNGAVSGAVNNDMLSQAQWLVSKMKADSKINVASDWKMLTIWIGSNNLCKVCDDPNNNNGANFEKQLTSALQFLYTNLPRLFVNLVSPLDVAGLYSINNGACGLLHTIACPCTSDSTKRGKITSAVLDYNTRVYNISRNFNGKKSDFAVVVQPFLSKSVITDRNLLSSADCFHPSALCHGYLSIGLWNNLLSPSSQKKNTWSASDLPICPTSNTLLYTS